MENIITFYTKNSEKESAAVPQQASPLDNHKESKTVGLEEIFLGLELTSSLGISQSIQRFNAVSATFHNNETFWQEVFNCIKESDAVKFLYALVSAESADMYDIKNALSSMPQDWRHKISVKRKWPNVLEMIARRFASQFTNHYTLKYFIEAIHVEKDEISFIHKGILEGLSNSSDLVNADTFFGFVEIVSTLISPQNAIDLLDFALTRFELHIDDDYADGCWSNWLMPPDNITTALTGLVWAALGSPRSEMRWQAAHCVRRIAEANCGQEIDALIEWMGKDNVGAFGIQKFPFYNLHARLYLLIALARVSIDNSQILKRHYKIFSLLALGGTMHHIIIQKFSAEIALNIEKAFLNTYSRDVVEQLHQVGLSQLPVKEINDYKDKLISYWHIKGEVDRSLKFYHAYDFDRYWFEPLGNVFGISSEQVEELATEVIINEWNVKTDGIHINDPRIGLWRSQRNERETWHDHGSYPHVDDYSFYLSYHSMLAVAAKLLQKMPVVHKQNWYIDEEWSEWLHRHLLTRNDGHWLADRRDPAPLQRRRWIYENKTENWRKEITSVDFLDGILFEHNGQTWLNVFGSWEDGDNEHRESFYVSTALVSPNTSQSLLNALSNCSNPNDYKLPDYQEEKMEFDLYPFKLKGWVWRSYKDNCLDEYDTFAGQISFPPYQIGKSIVEQLKLSTDAEQREWYLDDKSKSCLLCEIWSSNKVGYDEDRLQQGIKLSASLKFLKKLCQTRKSELIIAVQIDRRLKKKYNRSKEDGMEYQPPYSKIYILSQEGELRDEGTNYKLRERPS